MDPATEAVSTDLQVVFEGALAQQGPLALWRGVGQKLNALRELRSWSASAATPLAFAACVQDTMLGPQDVLSGGFLVPLYNGVHITKNPAIFSGRPIINGPRITVHDIVVHHRSGMSVKELAEGYSLTLEEVAVALTYYKEHKATIDRQIAADRREFARRAAADTSPPAERMREIGKASRHRQAP